MPKTSGLIYGASGRHFHRTGQSTWLIKHLHTVSLKEVWWGGDKVWQSQDWQRQDTLHPSQPLGPTYCSGHTLSPEQRQGYLLSLECASGTAATSEPPWLQHPPGVWQVLCYPVLLMWLAPGFDYCFPLTTENKGVETSLIIFSFPSCTDGLYSVLKISGS